MGDEPRLRIAVIGGGISGLAAAHRARELHPSADVVLFEASKHLGGVLQTETRDGFLIEHGADNFITTVPWAVDFCRRIGFAEELVPTNPSHRGAFVVRRGQLRRIPPGFIVMAPSRLLPVALTPILSPRGKLRMACERFVPRRGSDEDESLASFVTRRFGREMYERLAQPLVASIYAADAEKLSLAATMPRFLQMEREHGSLTRAMLRERKVRRDSADKESGGVRYSQFVAPRRGMSSLVRAIVEHLQNVRLLVDSPVEKLTPTSDQRWRLDIGGRKSRQMTCHAVILATPSHHSARLLQAVDALLAANLARIEYGSSAIISCGFRREQIGHPLDSFGVVVPLVERRKILSASFSSVKYPGRAPDGSVLLRVFVGGACQSELLDLTDAELLELAQRELADLLAIEGQPVLQHVTRNSRSMPQYHVGHQSLVARIEAGAAKLPGFALASNALHGVGVPNCIHTGERAAEQLLSKLSQPDRGQLTVA